MVSIPRVLVAAPASGGGKTTVATGLMAALRLAGHQVAPYKVGPDYIDPGYHALASGRPGRNLDAVLCGPELIAPLLAYGFITPSPADIAVVEGVMGLYDGQLGTGAGSSAQIARVTRTPVVLVVDTAHASLTHAAVVAGLAGYDPEVTVAGVVLNRVASARHGAEVRRGIEALGIPVLGEIPRQPGIFVPSRHLGLVPAAERDASAAQVEALAEVVRGYVDLDAVLQVARSAPDLGAEAWDPVRALQTSPGGQALAEARQGSAGRPVVAVAGGRAFTFCYPETVELLEAAGCQVVEIDPLRDQGLPEGTCGLYLGGGFPEVYAPELAANAALHQAVRDAVADGLPVVGECAGLLVLCRRLDGHRMTGVLPLDAAMTPRLTMGYRTATAPAATLLAAAGEQVTGHEFHRTAVTPAAELTQAMGDRSAGPSAPHAADPAATSGNVLTESSAWHLELPGGGRDEGVASASVHASYLHLHWAGAPGCAARFAAQVHRYAARAGLRGTPGRTAAGPTGQGSQCGGRPPRLEHDAGPAGQGSQSPDSHGPDLHHHGDRDLAPGLVDLAVNVRVAAPPDWVVDQITASALSWASYPDPGPARAALARLHQVDESMVLPTAGGAEAFWLLARGITADQPTVVDPQFTEPEVALRAAGRRVERVLLGPADGFRLNPAQVPAAADLVVVGNPTNPTGVLHPAQTLLGLRRPNRVVVVDEAFCDEPGSSLIGPQMDGLLVLRSLTKAFGLAGVRAGYVVGDPDLVARLAAQQPPWSVSTPALAAIEACCTGEAQRWLQQQAADLPGMRADLTVRLRRVGLQVVDSAAPFVLVDTSSLGRSSVRPALARRGFAVRRGETFPGLGPTWIRVAVRDHATHTALADALASLDLTTDDKEIR